VERAYDAIQEAFAASLERHEVQHRLDVLRPTPKPAIVDQFVPPAQTPAIEARRDKIHLELSAYVAQIARDDRMPHVTFNFIVRYLVDPKQQSLAEAYAAIAAVEELAIELGTTDVGHVFHDHKFDEARILRAHQKVAATRSADLSAAARRVWARFFGSELAPLDGPLAK